MFQREVPVNAIGLDISSTSTGFVHLAGEPGQAFGIVDVRAWTPPARLDTLDRADSQAENLLSVLSNVSPSDTVIMIEAIGGGAFPGALIPIVTVTSILKFCLRKTGFTWIEPSNSQLKKYVGSASKEFAGKKEKIALEVYKRWGFEHPSNDVIDAFVLAQMGLAIADSSSNVLTSYQQDVIRDLRNPPAKKVKKKTPPGS